MSTGQSKRGTSSIESPSFQMYQVDSKDKPPEIFFTIL